MFLHCLIALSDAAFEWKSSIWLKDNFQDSQGMLWMYQENVDTWMIYTLLHYLCIVYWYCSCRLKFYWTGWIKVWSYKIIQGMHKDSCPSSKDCMQGKSQRQCVLHDLDLCKIAFIEISHHALWIIHINGGHLFRKDTLLLFFFFNLSKYWAPVTRFHLSPLYLDEGRPDHETWTNQIKITVYSMARYKIWENVFS